MSFIVALAWLAVTFRVSPEAILMDDRVAIRIGGLPPNGDVTIRAASRDQQGCWWRSAASFRARGDGSVDLTEQAPVSGSYAGVDGMGLFWSMQPERRGRFFFAISDYFRPIATEFEVFSGAKPLGKTEIVRRFAAPGVRAEPVNSNGVVGVLYRPGDDGRHPAVILLGGSEGGFPEAEGPMLASRGYLTLALAYFGTTGVPAAMQNIPIEYFGGAIRFLRDAKATVIGGSRGAEAALLIGATYPEVNGVVASSPSHVRWEGATRKLLPGGPAWTLGGQALPYVPFHIGLGFAARYAWAAITGGGVSLAPMFVDSLARATPEAEIPVERIRGPVLLGSGGADRKWPSAAMAQRAVERLRRNGHGYADELVSYAGAGHWLPVSYVPTGGLRGRMAVEIGGTPEGTAQAQREWWPRVLEFLRRVAR